MSFCTVKPEHLTWTVEMTGALMRENLSPEDIVKDIANMLPSNNMFMKATLVSKIPQYIKLIMARNDELSRFYGPKFMGIQDLKESFESEKGYANVLEFVNGVTLSDKVDATIDAIEEEKIEEEAAPKEEVEPIQKEIPTTEDYRGVQNLEPKGNEEFRKSFIMKTKRGDTIQAEIVKYPGNAPQVVKVEGFGALGQYNVNEEVKKRYSDLEQGDKFKFVSQQQKSDTLTRKINASSKKPIDRTPKIIREAGKLEPNSMRDEAMLYFINGGKIHNVAIQELFGPSKEEKRLRRTILTDDEKYLPKAESSAIEALGETLARDSEFIDSEGYSIYDSQDYANEVSEILQRYISRQEMAESLLESRRGTNEQVAPEGYEDFSEQEQSDEYPDEYVAFQMNERDLFEKALATEQVINVGIGHGIVIENKVETNEKSEQNQEAEKAKTGSDTKAGKRVIQDFGKAIRPSFRDAVPDRLKTELTEHQQTGANAIVQAIQEKKNFLLADGAGAGKTRILLTAAQALKNSGKRVLIVTENKEIISGSFKNDSKALGMPFRQEKATGSGESDGTSIVTMETYKNPAKINRNNYDVIIVDESQKVSGLTTDIAKSVKDFKGQVVYSSATPFDTEEKTVYLLPKLFGISEEEYLSQIGARIKTRGNNSELEFFGGKTKFYAVMNATHQRLISEGKMLHRRYEFFGNDNLNIDTVGNADEFGGGYSIEQVEEGISALAKDKIKKIFISDRDRMQGITREDKQKDINFAKATALKRVPESFKANSQLLNQVEQDLKDGKQVILYGVNVEKKGLSYEIMTPGGDVKKINRPVFIDQMTKKLKDRGIEFGLVIGGEKKRAETVDRFQNGELKVLLINQSGTTGINLNDTFGNAPRKLYIAGALPNAIQLEQVKGRVSRMNNASPAEVVYVSVNSNAEIKNRNALLGKVAIMNSILTGQQLDGAIEAQETKADIKKEIEEEPKAPYIEKQPGGTHFLVKNTKSIYKALGREGLQGEYKGFLKAWKFKIERLNEVQEYLNSISSTTIVPELQIKKIDGAIAAEEALAKEEQPGDAKAETPIDSTTIASLKDLLRPSDEKLRRANDEKNKPC